MLKRNLRETNVEPGQILGDVGSHGWVLQGFQTLHPLYRDDTHLARFWLLNHPAAPANWNGDKLKTGHNDHFKTDQREAGVFALSLLTGKV